MTSRGAWDNLRDSVWFVPSLLVAVSVGIAFVLITLDSNGGRPWMARWPRLFGGGTAGALFCVDYPCPVQQWLEIGVVRSDR